MDYIIKFDNREKELIKILEIKEYNIELENLEIGDIQFIDLYTKEIIIVIERKTLDDLAASIKDGRYKEQKERLVHSLKKSVRKIVLIEGDTRTFSLPQNTLNSVIINTMLRDNIHIHISSDKNSTIEFIENIILNLPKYYEDLQKEIIHGEVKSFDNEGSCHTGKKDNLTPQICFRNMLCQIPNVSIGIATVFAAKYGSMDGMITSLKYGEVNGENVNKEHILAKIANEKYGKNNRRIGDKTGEKIYNFLFGVIEEEPVAAAVKKSSVKSNKVPSKISFF
jgi:ERCC4-type nuclease